MNLNLPLAGTNAQTQIQLQTRSKQSAASENTTVSGSVDSSAVLNFEELQEIFLKEGLNALIAKLKELNLADIAINTDAQTGKTTVAVKVDGIEYTFTGAKGDNVNSTSSGAAGSAASSATPAVEETAIIKVDKNMRPEDQFNEFMYQLSHKFPDIYEQFGKPLEEYMRRHQSMGFNLDFLVSNFQGVSNVYTTEGDLPLASIGDIVRYAAGLTRNANTTFKAENYIKENLETTGDPAKVNILDLMNYLLGDNDEGINYFYSASGKAEPIWETFTGTPGEYTRIGDSDYYEKDGKYYFFQNRFIEGQYGEYYAFCWNTYNGEEGYRYSKVHPDFYERAKEWINDPERNYMAWEVDLYEVQEAIKAAGNTQSKAAEQPAGSKSTPVNETSIDSNAPQNSKSYTSKMSVGGVDSSFSGEDGIAVTDQIDDFLAKLKEKYPEVYDEYASYISAIKTNSFGEMYYSDGIVRGDSFVHRLAAGDPYYYPQIEDVLKVAANITGNETLTEQCSKMTALFQKMGAQGNYMEVDIITLMNYLLGDNAEGVNYFDSLKSQRNAAANQVSNTDVEIGTPDASISVEVYEPNKIQDVPSPNNDIAGITEFIKNLLDPIYAKYFAQDSNGGYINFELGQSDWSNPDSGDYGHITWTWKDEATKEAFAKEVEAVIAKAMEKYSDILTSIMFDGQRVVFTTVYDSDNPDNAYTPINESGLNGTTALNGLAHGVFGHIELPGGYSLDPAIFEAAVDNPVSYTSAPDVVSNNIPKNAPVGVNGENLVKTAWDGIWVSEDGSYIYLWDSKEQTYKAVENYITGANGGSIAQSLANGYTEGLPYGAQGYDIDNILLSLIYGYNRTDLANVFEKDGKYYTYDVGTKRHQDGLAGLEQMLKEITFDKAVVPTAAPAKSSAPSSNQSEEVTIKSDDCLTEMESAAKKLGLTGSKTNGVYYNFTTEGSYLYIWEPVEKKFKSFSINSRNADGSINQEFTQTGKAVQRTEINLYYEAILEAYKNGYNFTVNFPWECEKDGVYYEYDKENGVFVKK